MELKERNELKKNCEKKLKAIYTTEKLEKAIEVFESVINGMEHIEFKIGEDKGIISTECAFEIIPIMIERNKKKIAELKKELEDKPKFATGAIVNLVDYVVGILEHDPNSEERMPLINKLINDLNTRKVKNPSKAYQILQYLNGWRILRTILLQAHSISLGCDLITYIGNWDCLKQDPSLWEEIDKKYKKWYFSNFKD